MRKLFPLLIIALIPILVLAAVHNGPATKNAKNASRPILRGDEPVTLPAILPGFRPDFSNLDDIIGDTSFIGTTWYDNQHNGTIGRMLAKSSDDYMHFAWMKGMEAGVGSPRHVFYNAVDLASGDQEWPGTGYQIDASSRAGYVTLDAAYDGICFPAFHQVYGDVNPHACLGFDFGPHLGAFQNIEITYLMENDLPMQLIWPHMMFDRSDEMMHVFSTEYALTAGAPQRQYYTPGAYDPVNYTINYPQPPDSAFRSIGWTMTIAGDVATSPVSDRVIFAWTYCRDEGFPGGSPTQFNNDIQVLIDDDGQDFHFEDFFNLTQFIPPQQQFYPDTVLMDADTFRVYTDLNVFIDQNDWAHVVFTTPSYFQLEGTFYWHASIVWHWSEEFPGEFQVVHNAFDDYEWNYVDCGAWNFKAQRPELAQDPSNGYLYCMYQVYDTDTTRLSQSPGQSGYGLPSGEVYVSVSTDGGANWAVGTNITNTHTRNNAPPGDCKSELTPSLCKEVDEQVHIMYVYDLDAGNIAQTEGQPTNNPVVYHTVPVDLIPTAPLVEQTIPFHVEHVDTNLTIPGSGRYEQPVEFGLKQNYPNPFNPTTTIAFSLDQVSEVSLNVYNVAGELVASIAQGTFGTGEHAITFDASSLSSGVYLYKLKAGNRTLERKMLLMK